ncbi:MAG: methylglyoxal synthase [Myxococcaceae bacterium]|nr:methylglyoxal synthase [Myxococcaceae bacterium]MCI0670153.1 methylglyoxal synthase [Myxococcaceae bacterium]
MPRAVALIAHDNKKQALVDWARRHHTALSRHKLYATGTTGKRLIEDVGLEVERLLSGPLGGDAQMGALVATGHIGAVIFFVDPLTAMPHDPDVRGLLRICDVHDVPLATNPSTAEYLVTSPLFSAPPP